MKKIFILLFSMLLIVSMVACQNDQAVETDQPEQVESNDETNVEVSDENSEVSGTQTSSEERVVVLNGELPKMEGPVYLTSVGQSADVSMLDALLKKVDIEYEFNPTATAEDLSGANTVIIAAGASSKGLGAAGISAEDETNRAQEILDLCESEGKRVVFAHLGGGSRRGELSDQFADQVLDYSEVLLVVEDGNEDGKFTDYASSNGKVIALINSIADTVEPLESLFK